MIVLELLFGSYLIDVGEGEEGMLIEDGTSVRVRVGDAFIFVIILFFHSSCSEWLCLQLIDCW